MDTKQMTVEEKMKALRYTIEVIQKGIDVRMSHFGIESLSDYDKYYTKALLETFQSVQNTVNILKD